MQSPLESYVFNVMMILFVNLGFQPALFLKYFVCAQLLCLFMQTDPLEIVESIFVHTLLQTNSIWSVGAED